MRVFVRLIIILALAYLGYVLFNEAHAANADAEHSDPTKLMLLFAGIIMIALVIGTILALSLVPAIADKVGGFFYNPDEKIEKDPSSVAISKMAQGDFQGAVEEYARIFEKNPDDTHALSEIVHIYCDRLGEPQKAAEVLENVLQNEWPPEQMAFFATRLVDVYWDYQRDAERSQAVLEQIIGAMPGTKFSANATHRLHDIQRIVLTGHLPPPKGPVPTNDETSATPDHGLS